MPITNTLNLKFHKEGTNEYSKYQKTLFFILATFIKRNDMLFYVSVINNFDFKFLKNGTDRPDFCVGTMFKNKKISLIINPNVFFKKTEQEMIFTLIHEAEHILNFHIAFDMKKDLAHNAVVEVPYNYITKEGVQKTFIKKVPLATIAMDLEVNSLRYKMVSNNNDNDNNRSSDYLLQDGIFPREKQFSKLSPYKNWESYYEDILEDAKQNKNGFSMSPSGLSGVLAANGDNVSNNWISDDDANDMQLTPLDVEQLKMMVNDFITFASSQAAGNTPGKYVSYLEELGKAKYDWKNALSQFVASGLTPTCRISKRKLNRRAINKKAFMPGTVAERDVNIVVAIDVSGSIDQSQFEASVAHLNKLRLSTNSKMWVMCFDAAINTCIELTKNNYKDLLKTKVGESYSRGGTAFMPIFDRILTDKNLKNPDVVVIFTDGYNYDVINENPIPRIPLLWVYTPEHAKKNFGRYIIMNDYK